MSNHYELKDLEIRLFSINLTSKNKWVFSKTQGNLFGLDELNLPEVYVICTQQTLKFDHKEEEYKTTLQKRFTESKEAKGKYWNAFKKEIWFESASEMSTTICTVIFVRADVEFDSVSELQAEKYLSV